ncbi:MAG: nucleotidyltransferase domain-containing protein [Deltaproteobacteria bacterium]|nr:nucleotidyltransferase domain-containing protein [Deltaproteobacteria bacterium]
MPVRSLNSSVLKWPDRKTVDASVRQWVKQAALSHPELIRLGYFGSYATEHWGVGSDLDIVAIVKESTEPFLRRSVKWDLSSLPVPADLLIYTLREWERMQEKGGRFIESLEKQVVWVYNESHVNQDPQGLS